MEQEDVRASLRAVDEGLELLEKGFSLLIFPEGTRTKSDEVLIFKKGSLRLATKSGVPVIPITIRNSYRVFEESGYIKRGTRVEVLIHPAIKTDGMDKAAASKLAMEVENIIKSGNT